MSELLLQNRHELLPDLVLVVEGVEGQALLVARVPPHGAHVDHAVPELDKRAPLDGDVEVGDVVQAEVGQLLPPVLAQPLDEAVGGQLLAELVRREAVLGEAEVEERGDGDARGLAELLLLLGQVGAADEADGALLAEGRQHGEGFRGCFLRDGALSVSGVRVGRGGINVRGAREGGTG